MECHTLVRIDRSQDMTQDEVKAMKEQTDFEGPLYQWKEKGHKRPNLSVKKR